MDDNRNDGMQGETDQDLRSNATQVPLCPPLRPLALHTSPQVQAQPDEVGALHAHGGKHDVDAREYLMGDDLFLEERKRRSGGIEEGQGQGEGIGRQKEAVFLFKAESMDRGGSRGREPSRPDHERSPRTHLRKVSCCLVLLGDTC